ncbi:MAG: LPS export ABC transporter permease LptF [Magnetococcales bacterium]|nr:LPS export ABC transporter permease LptF [Magnetococcales bacterium]
MMAIMNRLSRYLFVECAVSLVFALLILTFLIMLPRTLQLVDLWINKGVSVAVLGEMILLLVPQFIVAALPMAVLTGVLLSLGRFSQDSEMVVIQASGVSLYQLLRPIALLVGIFSLFSLFFEMVWVPQTFHQFRQLRLALVSSTTLTLKPQTFSHVVPGLTIYIDTHDPTTQTMGGILIYDQRKEEKPVTLIAKSGRLHTLVSGNAAIFLTEGSRHEQLSDTHYRQLKFGTYDLELDVSLGLGSEESKKGLEEMGMSDLDRVIREDKPERSHRASMEWHRRWAFPMATFILGVLALPLGLQQSHRSGRSYGLVVAVLILIVHIFLLSLGEAIAKDGGLSPIVGYGLPTGIMAMLTVYILVKTARGKPFKLALVLVHIMASLPLKLLRPGAAIGKKN